METNCKNHPDQPTKRKCFYCEEYICATCQHLIRNHLYCSYGCFLQQSSAAFKNQMRQSMLKIKNIFSKSPASADGTGGETRNSKNPLFIILASLIFIISLIVNLFFYYKINQLERPNKPTQSEIKPDSISQRPLKFDPAIPAMVTKNIITLEGEAPENTVICLLQNDKIKAVTLPQNGKFIFRNVILARDINKIVIKAINDSGHTIDLENLAITFNSSTPDYLARDFTRGEISLKKVALTFDGDYLDNNALPILDALKSKNIKVTFFLTGRFIQNYANIILRMLQDGHEIGNHTRHHPHLTTFEQTRQQDLHPGVTRELLHRELQETEALFKKATGKEIMRLWRAPYGEHNDLIRKWAAELGYRQIGWTFNKKMKSSLDTFDWVADTKSQLYRTPDQILKHIIEFDNKSESGLNGGIILMHLGSERNGDFPHEIISSLIDSLQARGYEFTKISSMSF